MLAADLQHAAGFLGLLRHLARLVDGERHRLFEVNVFAGLEGVDRHRRVPMVGRGDENTVDVGARQQIMVVAVDILFIHARQLACGVDALGVNIADGDDAHVASSFRCGG